MTVYNTTTLKNRFIRQEAKEAFKKLYISADTYKEILGKFPVDLYMPNVFVKIGLAVLTIFISLCTVGLVALFFDINRSFGTFLIVIGFVCYAVLEIMTGQKKHYNSGVDNVLMAGTVLFISLGLSFGYSVHSAQLISFVIFIVSAWLATRFADRFAAIAATAAFLSFVFNAFVDAGKFTVSIFPYLLIVVCGCIYYFSNRLEKHSANEIYKPLWQTISVIGLLAFYFSGNYYVIDNLTKSSFQVNQHYAFFPSFFWVWTMAFPIVCFVKGIQRKDVLLIRAGVILITISILTFRYYYSIVPAETAMVIAGGLLLMVSYLLMRYFRSARHGFVFDNKPEEESESKNLEGFVIGQTLGGHHRQPQQDTKFGGGSFGGAGSGSDY